MEKKNGKMKIENRGRHQGLCFPVLRLHSDPDCRLNSRKAREQSAIGNRQSAIGNRQSKMLNANS
jgi:hypothetical protein